MSFSLKLSRPPKKILSRLQETGLKEGDTVLDYACGPGLYSVAAAGMVGDSGKIYAADIHPLASEYLDKGMLKHSRSNYEAITTGCILPLKDGSIDIAFLFDVYHLLPTPDDNIREISRVLKPEGKLFLIVDHIDPKKVVNHILTSGLFKLIAYRKETIELRKT